MTGDDVEVTVVLPTLDEAGNIRPLLEALADQLDGRPFEVLIVDGGSQDGTVAEAQAAAAPVRVLVPSKATDLGPSVAYGLAHARGRYVVVMDADGQHPPDAVPRLLSTFDAEGSDMVVGTRYVEDGGDPGFGPGRRFVSWTARRLAWLALPSVRRHGLTDPTSGFFAVDTGAVDVSDIDARGYKIMLDVLAQSGVQTVSETGYVFQKRAGGESNLGPGTVVTYLIHLLQLAAAERWNHRVVLFGLVGLLGVLVNLGILYGLTEGADLHYMISASVAVEVSILHNWAWNDAVTFKGRRSLAWPRRLLRFNVASLGAMAVNLLVLAALVEALGVHYLAAAAIAIAVAFIANLGFNLTWVYPSPEGERA